VLSNVMRLIKDRSSHKVQRGFPDLRKRFWGKGVWGQGIFQPPTAHSPKTSYFNTWKTTSLILPTPARSRSVPPAGIFLNRRSSGFLSPIPGSDQMLKTTGGCSFEAGGGTGKDASSGAMAQP